MQLNKAQATVCEWEGKLNRNTSTRQRAESRRFGESEIVTKAEIEIETENFVQVQVLSP